MDLEIATVHDALHATKSDTTTWFQMANCRFFVFYRSKKIRQTGSSEQVSSAAGLGMCTPRGSLAGLTDQPCRARLTRPGKACTAARLRGDRRGALGRPAPRRPAAASSGHRDCKGTEYQADEPLPPPPGPAHTTSWPLASCPRRGR